MEKEAIRFHRIPVPEYGPVVYERSSPSEPSLSAAVVVRLVEFLEGKGFIGADQKTMITLCLDEAVKNAMVHGNESDVQRATSVAVYECPEDFWVVISDRGRGFEPESIPDPLGEDRLLRESGRGIHLMQHLTKTLEFWNCGSSVALCFPRSDVDNGSGSGEPGEEANDEHSD